MDPDCMYCTKNQKLKDLMIEVCDLKVSTLYLHRDQTYKGRSIVTFKGHKNELFDIDEEDLKDYIIDIKNVAFALKKAFGADKINCGAMGDRLPHYHMHIFPKYKDGFTWGGQFNTNPPPANKVTLNEAEYDAMIVKLKEILKK